MLTFASGDWVRRQDALDRKRYHFMKDFRKTNGFDRAACTPDQEVARRAGLDRVNAEVDEVRRAAADASLLGHRSEFTPPSTSRESSRAP